VEVLVVMSVIGAGEVVSVTLDPLSSSVVSGGAAGAAGIALIGGGCGGGSDMFVVQIDV
jgi:hypothetical protein